MLNGHSIKLPNKAKSLSQLSCAALRLIREVCVVHSGERKTHNWSKSKDLVFVQCQQQMGRFYYLLSLQGSGTIKDEGGGKTVRARGRRGAASASSS